MRKRLGFVNASVIVVGVALLNLAYSAAEEKAFKKVEPGDELLGKWWFPKKNGQMEITKKGDIYSGKVISYEDPDALDDENPDPKLRTRKFVGIEMLSGFKYNADKKQYVDGTIYDGDSGKTYSGYLWFEEGQPDKLNGRGYVGLSFFGRTEVFERVQPDKSSDSKKSNGVPKAKN
ncbi:MAG: DUF2147 domain-containing protein [Planctomycetota bacterium]